MGGDSERAGGVILALKALGLEQEMTHHQNRQARIQQREAGKLWRMVEWLYMREVCMRTCYGR
jgi:hypothetical protein